MKMTSRRATIVFCSVVVAAVATTAIARPVHHHRHRAMATASSAVQPQSLGADRDMRFSFNVRTRSSAGIEGNANRHERRALGRARAQSHANSAYGGATSNALVVEARRYIGTNPTGRGSLWCGAFMDLVLKRTGHPGGGNLAKAYAHYGTRVSNPQVGAIAVMGRRGGGHVGVVSGVDPNGNPIIVSGNHNHTVAESVYPASRISAYVLPGG